MLLNDILNPNISELLILYFKTRTQGREAIANLIIDLFVTEHYEYANRLLQDCTKDIVFNYSPLLKDKLKLWLFEQRKIRIFKSVIQNCNLDKEYSRYIFETFLKEEEFHFKLQSLSSALAIAYFTDDLATESILKISLQEHRSKNFPYYELTIAKYFTKVSPSVSNKNSSGNFLRNVIDKMGLSPINKIFVQLWIYLENREIEEHISNDLNDYLQSDVSFEDKIIVMALIERLSISLFQKLQRSNTKRYFVYKSFEIYSLITESTLHDILNTPTYYSISKKARYKSLSNLMEKSGPQKYISFNDSLYAVLNSITPHELVILKEIRSKIQNNKFEFLDETILDK